MINEKAKFEVCPYNKCCASQIANTCYTQKDCPAYLFYLADTGLVNPTERRTVSPMTCLEDITQAIERGEIHG